MEKKYDVGILGVWSGCNYGSIATYYALNQIISSMGKSVLMIDKPILSEKDVEREETHSRRFGREHYHISEQYRLQELSKLNAICDAFVIGSDQVWNYGISKNFGKAFYLDFAEDNKKKVAYAVSFGHGVDFAPPEQREIISNYMSRFDGISVREADGVRLCRDEYGIAAQQVLDPVFVAEPKIFEELAQQSKHREEEPYIAAYILDPTPEKREALLHLSQKMGGIKIINMLDGLPWLFAKNKALMDLPNCVENLQVEDWLYFIKNARFVVTDSCHGASFAIIFKRNFIAITNKRRGYSRFKSLSDLFGFGSHLVTDPKRILQDETLLEPIDYQYIDAVMKEERRRCYKWLKNVLNAPKKSEEELRKQNDARNVQQDAGFREPIDYRHIWNTVKEEPKRWLKNTLSIPRRFEKEQKKQDITQEGLADFARCRMLVTLLRDYGIKNIVLSTGLRNLSLARLFEANDCFKVYSVVDERSAGFYALGISLKTQEPVVLCCTSGTAAANYLPAVAEAFYQQIPLIVITTDTYSYFSGQNDNQAIPEMNKYQKVCKKSVTLPMNADAAGERETRRAICDAILETAHHGKGPVHINVPIASIDSAEPELSALELGKPLRRIERITLAASDKAWNSRAKRLSIMKRILLVYGQERPVGAEEQRVIDAFCEKYHCVVLTDHLSNFRNNFSVIPYFVLRGISQERFDRDFAPDIVITIGGRRIQNDPSLTRLCSQKPPLAHWRVAEDGLVIDTYGKLSRVFECSAKQFFERFVKAPVECENGSAYVKTWKRAEKRYAVQQTNKYSQLYVVEKTVKSLPDNSCLHYGIANTSVFASRFLINPTVEVFCNMGTNGSDGAASTFMGYAAASDRLSFLIISDMSFFCDMNAVWDKALKGNMRIIMCNNRKAGSGTAIREWVKTLGFTYLTASNKEEFDQNIRRFVSFENVPMFFEVFAKF